MRDYIINEKGEKQFKVEHFDTIKKYMQYCSKEYRDLLAIIYKRNGKNINLTFPEFEEEVCKLAVGLENMGLKEKQIVIIGKNSYQWILVHSACLYSGIVSIPLDKALQETEIQNSLKRISPEAIFVDKLTKKRISSIIKGTSIKHVLSLEEEGKDTVFDIIEKTKNLPKEKFEEMRKREIDPDATKVLIFTSGTTSKSKIVMLTNRNIVSDIIAIQSRNFIEGNKKTIMILPLHHVYGSTGAYYMLFCGVCLTFIESMKSIGKNLKEYQPTYFFAVPVLLELIYKKLEQEIKKEKKYFKFQVGVVISNILRFFGIDKRREIFKDVHKGLGGNVSCVMSGASSIDKKLIKKFDNIGIMVLQGYGLTESSPCVLAEDLFIRRPGTIGRPFVGVDVRLGDMDKDGIGEIQLHGDMIFKGYYKDEKNTKEAFTEDGWFKTGDLAKKNKDGTYVITGRKKDMIVLDNGKKVFPNELEILIDKIPYIKESLVYADKNDRNNLQIEAKLVIDEEYVEKNLADKTMKDLRDMAWEEIKKINKTFPPYKYIKDITVTDQEFEKTTTLKIKRYIEIKKIMEEKNK